MGEEQQEQKQPPAHVEELRRRVARLHALANTPEVKEMIEILRRQFLNRLQGKDELDYAFRSGCANVVAWLMEAQQYNPEGR